MNHVTDEQLEDILQGRAGVPEHMEQCPQCRTRLAEKRALAQRVHRAFAAIQASPDLGARIRAGMAEGRPRAQASTSRQII
jgi:anti-sigma factor RsiW